jgi:hypothetical protein
MGGSLCGGHGTGDRFDQLGLPMEQGGGVVRLKRVLTLVANSKMGEMILCTPASEAQRNMVDPWAETPTSIGESRLERIRHQYQCST